VVAVGQAPQPVSRATEGRWREAENTFFASAMADADLYASSLALVRGLAAGLRDVTSEAALEAASDERGLDWAERRLAEIDVPDAGWLDLATALDAAFALRLTELRSEVAAGATAARLAAARAAGEAWLLDVDGETGPPGLRTYRRVEIHTTLGVALYGYSDRQWGRDESFWFEVVRVDPETGSRDRGAPPVRRPRACRDRAALQRAFAAARRRYEEGA
jgi:hypothetical protein